MSGVEKLWARCTNCNRCEWNAIHIKNNLICKGCKQTVDLYRPRRRVRVVEGSQGDEFYDANSDVEADGPQQPHPVGILKPRSMSPQARGGGKGGKGASPKFFLQQALSATTDANLQKDIQNQIDKLTQSEKEQPVLSHVEALRRADGAQRNAEHIHTQAVAAVMRLRGNLAAAEAKETAAARALAEAEDTRRLAARALAQAEGVTTESQPEQENNQKFINVQWDESFFNNLEALDCTPTEKEALQELHQQLQGVKQHLEGKETEIQTWLADMQRHREAIEARMAKKRKTEPPAEGDPTHAAAGLGEASKESAPKEASQEAAPPAAGPPPGAPGNRWGRKLGEPEGGFQRERVRQGEEQAYRRRGGQAVARQVPGGTAQGQGDRQGLGAHSRSYFP